MPLPVRSQPNLQQSRPLEDGARFIAVTTDSAERLNAAIRVALASAQEHRRRDAAPSS